MGTSLEDRPRYAPSTTFETFPFPECLTPNIPAAAYADAPRAQKIAAAAARLNELRENWLNPPDLVKRVPEVVPGYPDRILPVSPEAEAEATLKKRTLTNRQELKCQLGRGKAGCREFPLQICQLPRLTSPRQARLVGFGNQKET